MRTLRSPNRTAPYVPIKLWEPGQVVSRTVYNPSSDREDRWVREVIEVTGNAYVMKLVDDSPSQGVRSRVVERNEAHREYKEFNDYEPAKFWVVYGDEKYPSNY